MKVSKPILLLVWGWLLLATPAVALTCFSGGGQEDWNHYKARFISADGRLIDTGNQNISHSEGQGFGLRLALFFEDRETFAKIWGWTRENLYVRGDQLAAWRWRPDQAEPVTDLNNASDGDVLIAWALGQAGRRWEKPDYLAAARAIAAEIRAKLLRNKPYGLLLLPGLEGFERDEGLILNPSYWVFPALEELAMLNPPADTWRTLRDTGLRMLEEARFGRWELPPDWVVWNAGFALPTDFKPRFGYDAIRVPLYLVWGSDSLSDQQQLHRLLNRFLGFWENFVGAPFVPDWTDLSNDAVSSHDAPAGIKAVINLIRFVMQSKGRAAFLSLPPLNDQVDYYSASLSLLVRAAATEWCQRASTIAPSH
jgi:endoglucanase